jgi:hypothetical protein
MKNLITCLTVTLLSSVVLANTIPMESKGHGRSNFSSIANAVERQLTFSEQFGLDLLTPPVIEYGPLDFATITREDDTRLSFGGRHRVAIKRELHLHEHDGEWLRVPDAWLWRIEIACESSLGVNLHFVDVNLPMGAELMVYDVHAPTNLHGPFTGTGDFGTGEIWAASVGTDRIRIEYFVPLSTRQMSFETLPFFVADLHDVYVDFLGGGNGRFGDMSCYEDPACHSEWDDVAKGMAQILVANAWTCSGGLIATADNDETPYYYTANHCVGTESDANSLTFYFGYQRVTCNGGVSSGTSVSGGADLVAASPNSQDGNTLVMIKREIPREIYFPGFNMSNINYGTNTTGLHFPAGSYMRISFGDYVGSDSLLAYQSWVPADGHGSGSAEPGSSGSHIFRDSDKQVYGALLGGAGVGGCANPETTNYYNRLSAAGFSGHLTQGTDDDFEDNDTCDGAYDLEYGLHTNLIVKSTDEDWYHLTLENGKTLFGTLSFTDVNGNIDLEIYRGCGNGDGGELVASSQTNGNDEYINYTNDTGATDDFYLRTYLAGWGTRNEYSINMSAIFQGACCVGTSDSCLDVPESLCLIGNGIYQGDGSVCAEVNCLPEPDCPADIDGDNAVNVSDLLMIIDQWGQTNSPADVNEDGIVNVSDLLIVIDNWGECE